MNSSLFKSFLIILIIAFGLLPSCKKVEKVTFSGTVVSVSNESIDQAQVTINGETSKTDQEGRFKINLKVGQTSYLVRVEKFGYGLYSRSFVNSFSDKEIILTQGTVVEFDPSIDNVIEDTNSSNSIAQSTLLELDTSLLFGVVPRVYDHNGKLIDLGYPDEVKGIFDYVRTPRTGRRGMSMQLRANSLRSSSGNLPPAGRKLKASVSTVDFFNPDGMPGNFVVRFKGDPKRFDVKTIKSDTDTSRMDSKEAMKTKSNQMRDITYVAEDGPESLAFMESYGAATIDISDGEESYQLEEGMTATVTIPVYSIRQEKNEIIPQVIPLLHYNESDGVWEVTGKGVLNETRDAYVGEIRHFSVVNFDMVKTGDSKCFKIRQLLINGANDNTTGGGGSGALATFRAHILVPQTATSTFSERQRTIDELTGCVSVQGTSLHGVSRIDNDIPYIVTVFSQAGVGATDTLNIAIVAAGPNSIAAETAVTDLADCATATCVVGDDCTNNTEAINFANHADVGTTCNNCWQPNCPIIPFDNSGADPSAIVGVPMGSGDITVKWVNRNPAINSLKVTVHYTDCNQPELAEIQALCSGCIGNTCNGGAILYNGTPGETVYFKLTVYNESDCSGAIPLGVTCSSPVTIL